MEDTEQYPLQTLVGKHLTNESLVKATYSQGGKRLLFVLFVAALESIKHLWSRLDHNSVELNHLIKALRENANEEDIIRIAVSLKAKLRSNTAFYERVAHCEDTELYNEFCEKTFEGSIDRIIPNEDHANIRTPRDIPPEITREQLVSLVDILCADSSCFTNIADTLQRFIMAPPVEKMLMEAAKLIDEVKRTLCDQMFVQEPHHSTPSDAVDWSRHDAINYSAHGADRVMEHRIEKKSRQTFLNHLLTAMLNSLTAQ